MRPSAAVLVLLTLLSPSWIHCADKSASDFIHSLNLSKISADKYNSVKSIEEVLRELDPEFDEDETPSPTEDTPEQTTERQNDVGEKLFLTPYLEAGHLDEARELSKVKGGPFPDHVESYSGFFTINPQLDSNLFFWFFQAEKNYLEAPIIVWLQGGPGQPSLIGIFMEIGPFTVAADNSSLEDNPNSWHKNYNLLFIDNPVGTGFSFTNNESGYARNQNEIADGLYNAVLQFFTLFPELQENQFYIAGESYGGKHAVSLAHFIHNRNPSANITINLKGLFLVSGFIDPVNCLYYSDLLYQVGLVDFNDRKAMKIMEHKGRDYIRQGMYEDALSQWNKVLYFCQQTTHIHQIYNFLTETYPSLDENAAYFQFVQRPEVRRAIHVGEQEVVYVGKVYRSLSTDMARSVKSWLEDILNAGYRVVCFSGQLDVIVAYPLSVRTYLSLSFAASKEYREVKRRNWYEDGELAGYTKTAGNFTEVLVRGAGHMVPLDKPRWTLSFINTVFSETND